MPQAHPLNGYPKYLPQPGKLLPFDQLKKLLSEQESETERQQKLETAKQTLSNCKSALQTSVDDLNNCKRYLEYLKSEDEWEDKYLAHAEKYRASFSMRTAQQERQQEIANMQQDIAYKKEILEAAEKWLEAPSNEKPRYQYPRPYDKPSEMAIKMPKTITIIETQLEVLKNSPVVESPLYQEQFRQYVRARVLVEKPLATLLKTQSDYLSAIKEFQTIYGQLQREILNLDVLALDQNLKIWSVDENNIIRQG